MHAATPTKPTYGYENVDRNVIVGQSEFVERIVGHPYKFESISDRLGSENSEDMLSWNVFRSLAEARLLGSLVANFLGEASPVEPDPYLWGIRINDGTFTGWHLLDRARERFEQRLPVERPKTEPDIAIHLPGRYLILIEAKFTSPNTFYTRGPRKDKQSLTHEELRTIYQDVDNEILDYGIAAARPRLFYQLWRNTTFAEWMARYDHRETRAYHINLVREGYDEESATEFATLIRPKFRDRFHRWTWEDLCRWFAPNTSMERCTRYMQTNASNLRPAFRLTPTAM